MVFLGLFLLAIVLLPDLYLYFSFVRGSAILWCLLFWLPSLLTLGLVVALVFEAVPQGAIRWVAVPLLCVTFPKWFFCIVSLVGRGVNVWVPGAGTVGNYVALLVLLAGVGATVYGFAFGCKRLVISEHTLTFDSLPQDFEGYRIVHFSDLHVGAYGKRTAFVERVIRTVNALQPNLIVFTGDIVDMASAELLPFVDVLSQLRAPDGVMSVLGNHDYCLYGRATEEEKQAQVEEIKRLEQQFGWDLLLNQNRLIHRGDSQIAVLGVENSGMGHFPKRAALAQAAAGLDPQTFSILLSHDPSHWQMEVLPHSAVDLTLSGHTHAMQFQIGRFSPAKWMYPQWGGVYRQNNQQLYVSTGVGGTLPFRLGAWPKIEVLTLKRKDRM